MGDLSADTASGTFSDAHKPIEREKPLFDPFSEDICRHERLQLDPRCKLAVAGAALLAVLLSRGLGMPAAILAACLIAMVMLRIPLKAAFLRLAAPLGVVGMIVLLKGFMDGQGPVVFSVRFFDWTLAARQDGLFQGAMIGMRVMGAAATVIVLGFVTPAHEIFRALRWLKVSPDWLEIAVYMYRYAFALIDQATDIAAAQRLRLGYCGMRRSLRSMGTLAGSVFACAVDQGLRTHEAMTARGYRGQMPFAPLPPVSARDQRITLASVLALCAFFLIGEAVLI